MTPLHVAYFDGHDKLVQVLLDHGVQVCVQSKVSNISFAHLCNVTRNSK